MRPFWKFSKPKGPGFGISKNFYLSVLASRAQLPSIRQLIAPTQDDSNRGAIEGFGVPLAAGKDKSLLDQPMQRGPFALSTKDQKTVMRMLVMATEEAQFSQDAFLRTDYGQRLPDEVKTVIRGAWWLVQFSFETHDPDVYPATDFLLDVVQRLASLADGVVADPIAQRYLLPGDVRIVPRVDPKIDARDFVSIGFRRTLQGRSAHTLGLQKFTLPELEIPEVPSDLEDAASKFLLAAAQGCLMGYPVQSGSKLHGFEAREGGLDRSFWDGVPVFDLLPPTKSSSAEVLEKWLRDHRM